MTAEGASTSLRETLIRNIDEIAWSEFEREPRHASRGARIIGPGVAGCVARDLGASSDVLAPGKAGCPYHAHYAEEERFIVLEGSSTLRVAGESVPIRAGDVINIPPGPQYPHQIVNTSAAPLEESRQRPRHP